MYTARWSVDVKGVKQGAFATLHKAHPPGQGQSFGLCSFGQHGQDELLHGFEVPLELPGDSDWAFSSDVSSVPVQCLHFFACDVDSSDGVASGIELAFDWLRIK